MDQSDIFRNLSEAVSPSVVAVEDRNRNRYWVGCIIHKPAAGIFILTQSKLIKPNCQLYVHFHDDVVKEVKPLVYDNDSTFAVLYLNEQHQSSTIVQFRDQNFTYSDALCLIPKSVSIIQSITGFIPVPSCAANGDKGDNQSANYFLFMAHQEDTPTITPAPIFHKDENVNGFVIRDCVYHGDKKKVDVHMKLCIKSSGVVVWLRKIVGQEDWKTGLELKSKAEDPKDTSSSSSTLKLQKGLERKRKEPESKAAGKRPRRR